MSTDQQKIYADKIAKLLAKAESTTPEEAELLFEKAAELMAKYSIDEAMLASKRGVAREDNPYVEEEVPLVGIYRFGLEQIAATVLYAAGLKVLKRPGKNPRTLDGKLYRETVILIACGFKNDVERVRVLLTSLILQARRAESAWWEENKYDYSYMTPKEQHYQRRQFLFSFAYGVGEKMEAANARARAAADSEYTGNSVALVLRSKEDLLLAAFDAKHPKLKKSHQRLQGGGWGAHESGLEAGRQADIGDQQAIR